MYIMSNINAFIRLKHLEWAEHVWRSNSIIKKVMTETINEETPRGRPRQGWMNTIQSDLQNCAPGLMLEESKDREW